MRSLHSLLVFHFRLPFFSNILVGFEHISKIPAYYILFALNCQERERCGQQQQQWLTDEKGCVHGPTHPIDERRGDTDVGPSVTVVRAMVSPHRGGPICVANKVS